MESISKFHRKFLVQCVHPLIGLVKVGVPVPIPVPAQILALSVNHGVNRLSDAQLPVSFCHKIASVNINICIRLTNYQLFFHNYYVILHSHYNFSQLHIILPQPMFFGRIL